MKNTISIMFLLGFALLSFNGWAEDATEEEEFLTGKELLESCETDTGTGMPAQFCMQYVFGFVQNMEMLHSADPGEPRLFCIDPQKVGLPEVTTKMRNWLESKSGRLDQEAYLLVGEALATNYPCGGSTPF